MNLFFLLARNCNLLVSKCKLSFILYAIIAISLLIVLAANEKTNVQRRIPKPIQLDQPLTKEDLQNRPILAWSPSGTEFQTIMDNFRESTNLTLENFENSDQLENYIISHIDNCFAGVDFGANSSNAGAETILDIVIRIPSLNSWKTYTMYPVAPFFKDHDAPDYTQFLYVQHHISKAILLNYSMGIPTIEIEPFPYPTHDIKFVDWWFYTLVPVLCSYWAILISTKCVYLIVEERNNQVREQLSISGISRFVLWISWFLTCFKICVLGCIIPIIFIFVIRFKNATTIEHTHWTIFLMLWVLFSAAVSAACLLLSSLCRSEGSVFYISHSFWMSFECYVFYETITGIVRPRLLIFLFYNAYCLAFKYLFILENYGTGYNWNNLDMSPIFEDQICMKTIFIALSIETLVMFLFAYYFDAVLDHGNGYAKPWNFLFKPSSWFEDDEDETEFYPETGRRGQSRILQRMITSRRSTEYPMSYHSETQVPSDTIQQQATPGTTEQEQQQTAGTDQQEIKQVPDGKSSKTLIPTNKSVTVIKPQDSRDELTESRSVERRRSTLQRMFLGSSSTETVVNQAQPGPLQESRSFIARLIFGERRASVGRFEEDPDQQPTIRADHLTKRFGNKVAVGNASFNVFKNQTTVLMGHDGAGKTTLVRMIAGIIKPSWGISYINNISVQIYPRQARKKLGFCPKQNILSPGLFLKEQLMFYSMLRGLSFKEAEKEVEYLCEMAGLHNKMDSFISNLSKGNLRKACVITAFCGNTDVIILDEPTTSIDSATRRTIWNIINTQKEGRTIMLISPQMEEADALGDRIIIMANGYVQGIGTGTFLKRQFRAGFRVVIEKGPGCNQEKVFEFFRSWVKDVSLKRVTDYELVFDVRTFDYLSGICEGLERRKNALKIRSYSISRISLNELFNKFLAEPHEEAIGDLNTLEKGKSYSCNAQCGSLLYKRTLMGIRDYKTYIAILIFLIWILFGALSYYYSNVEDKVKLEMTLSNYIDPIVLSQKNNANLLFQMYKRLIDYQGGTMARADERIMETDALNKAENNIYDYTNRYIAGMLSERLSDVRIFYNDLIFHSLPLSYSLMINSVLISSKGNEYYLRFYNHPLNIDFDPTYFIQFWFGFVGGTAFYFSLILYFYLKEHKSGSQMIQYHSGASIAIYWITALIWEMIMWFILVLIALTIWYICNIPRLNTFEGFLIGLLILLPVGFCCICFVFLLSRIPVHALIMSQLLIIFIFLAPVAHFIMHSVILLNKGVWLFPLMDSLMIFPMTNFGAAFGNLMVKDKQRSICPAFCPVWSKNCSASLCNAANPIGRILCCEYTMNYFEWERPGLLKPMVMALIGGLIFFLVTFFVDSKLCMYCCKSVGEIVHKYESDEDDDVIEENKEVMRTPVTELQGSYPIALVNVKKSKFKSFSSRSVLKGISLRVPKRETFGLLGPVGAGKTTLVKVINADITADSGRIYVDHLNVRKSPNVVYSSVGYCPQTNSLIREFSGRENLIFYLMLQGYSFDNAERGSEIIAKRYGFYKHFDRRICYYSPGNMRKLQVAIAANSGAQVLTIDEPTEGMDPGSKARVYHELNEEKRRKTILISTQNSEDCEALCSRVGVLIKGRLKCLGSGQHLKTRYALGYHLSIKLKTNEDPEFVDKNRIRTKNYILNQIRDSKLDEEHKYLLYFTVSDDKTPWSRVFIILESAKYQFHLEEYSVTPRKLDEVFPK